MNPEPSTSEEWLFSETLEVGTARVEDLVADFMDRHADLAQNPGDVRVDRICGRDEAVWLRSLVRDPSHRTER